MAVPAVPPELLLGCITSPAMPTLTGVQGVTRFEDDTRLPLGIAINSSSYSAKALTQVSVRVRVSPDECMHVPGQDRGRR